MELLLLLAFRKGRLDKRILLVVVFMVIVVFVIMMMSGGPGLLLVVVVVVTKLAVAALAAGVGAFIRDWPIAAFFTVVIAVVEDQGLVQEKGKVFVFGLDFVSGGG